MSNQTRRSLLKRAAGVVAAAAAAPYVVPGSALGAAGSRPAASNRVVMGAVGVGGQGTGDLRGFLGFDEVQVVAVCDVSKANRDRAKGHVDQKNGNTDCAAVNDFREVVTRKDIDAILCATPDHWHAIVTITAMKNGKDIYCEKPESLTIREGRAMVATARQFGRVFSGGSQRVWGDYNWYHRMVRGGAIGEVKEGWANCGGPSRPCNLPGEPVPPGFDWEMWLGPAPAAPYNACRCSAAYGLGGKGWRSWQDYSGGMMTDWGAHNFGGALFAMGLQDVGPVEVIHPGGANADTGVTYVFANGMRLHHNGAWGGSLAFRGTKGECPDRNVKDAKDAKKVAPPNIDIPNYKGKGGIHGDFLYCVKTREKPFRDIDIGHHTATVCHLGNIAYWLGRSLKYDPVKEEIIGDAEASRWLDRPKRAPWVL
jgi:hypothetical protein